MLRGLMSGARPTPPLPSGDVARRRGRLGERRGNVGAVSEKVPRPSVWVRGQEFGERLAAERAPQPSWDSADRASAPGRDVAPSDVDHEPACGFVESGLHLGDARRDRI